MEKKDISERTVAYGLRVIRLVREMENDSVGRVIGKQILRCGTSIGANVHEAQGAQSKADFIAKMSIAQKETHETTYWLKLIREAKLFSQEKLTYLMDETNQLLKIISAILISAKNSKT